jgi:hypothetical protein
VTCTPPSTCTFSCLGENYDIDLDPTTGCEQVDSPLNNHLQGAATDFHPGGLPCDDSSSAINLSGQMLSDLQIHENPSVAGFDPASGSAPDWFTVVGNGGTFCQDDVTLYLQVANSSYPTCYALTFSDTSGDRYTCATDANGYCAISQSSGSYHDGDTLWWEVSKTCSTDSTESVSYTITGHL